MKTRAKRLAAILVAAVMTAAIAIPAFADDEAAITEMTFKKTVETDANTYQPNETFSFEVTPEAPTSNEKAGAPATVVTQGAAGGVTVSTVATDPTKKGTQSYETGKFTFTPSAFTQPGIYKYKVHETNTKTDNPDMNYAGDQYLYVYVRRNGDAMEVYAASLVDPDKTGEAAKSGEFTNVYKKNGGDGPEFADLTIKKTVAGDFGETNKDFEFTLNITSSDRTTYMATKTKADDTTEDVTVPAGGYTFTLKSGETLKVENLSSSDKYTVTETAAEGYTTEGTVTTATNMATSDVEVNVTNTRNAVTPTGIFMSYGPYIAMIAAAAVLAFVFLRKREEI